MSAKKCGKQRVKLQLKQPNPLFERWLSEWRDEAVSRESKMQYSFGRALRSLQRYPLPLQTGADCKILEGFGEKLCQMLDQKLNSQPKSLLDDTLPYQPMDVIQHFQSSRLATSKENASTSKIKKKPLVAETDSSASTVIAEEERYCPTINSGAYAILITLYKNHIKTDSVAYMTKAEIIKYGQHLCDKSFTRADPETLYTAWSSMKTVLGKCLVTKCSNPAKFSLTDSGLALAKRLTDERSVCDRAVNAEYSAKIVSAQSMPSSTTTDAFDSFVLSPNEFRILLIVDSQETLGSKKSEYDPLKSDLTHRNVPFEVRNLKVGDFAWIARDNLSGKELVLPLIVERKRTDDLACSIKDGRFHEQKFRLKQSGIQNLIYLIESHGSNQHTSLPFTTLLQAAMNTLVQDRFVVKFTDDLRGSATYLSMMTEIIADKYQNKVLASCPKGDLNDANMLDDIVSLMTFDDFNKAASKNKNVSVSQLFVRQLLQLKGISVDKALAIVELYPTPRMLHIAYRNAVGKLGETLLANIRFGVQKKAIGAGISKSIHQLFNLNKY